MSKEGTNISWMSDGRKKSPCQTLQSTSGGTLNSVVGCTPISPGCANCYAVSECWRMAHNPRVADQFQGVAHRPDGGRLQFTGEVNYLPDRLMKVPEDRNHRAWFVNSLSDLFHEKTSDEVIAAHFAIFYMTYWQEFRILTKRHERLLALSPKIVWPPNVVMGVTAENTDWLERISALGKTGADHKFVSFEPWLSPWPYVVKNSIRSAFPRVIEGVKYKRLRDLLRAARIECCIVGGESDRDMHRARCMDLQDATYILEEARAAGAHACLKQLGTRWAVASNTVRATQIDGVRIKGANHGAAKELWPKDLQKYNQYWPFLELPRAKPVPTDPSSQLVQIAEQAEVRL